MKMTIKDIARLSGVSISAVSIVLNNRKGVSDETRQRILDVIRENNYVPNPNSRRLVLNRTDNIAVLFKKNMSPPELLFYSDIYMTILGQCEEKGYNLLFTSVGSGAGEIVLPSALKNHDVDGVILIGEVNNAIIRAIAKLNIPFIIMDNHIVNNESLSIGANYEDAAYVATRHLITLGHRKISYLGNRELPEYDSQTYMGYLRAMKEFRLQVTDVMTDFGAASENRAFECARNLMAPADRPTALFCIADIYAIGAIRYLKSAGYRIPEDVSVVSIDNLILSKYIDPQLTTVNIDRYEIGRQGFDMLLRRIKNEETTSVTIKSDSLIVRESTAPPKSEK